MADRAPALLEHIVSRIEQDVQFLVDQHYISAQDAAAIVARLPSTTSQTSAPITSPPPTYAGAQPVMARALWAYNEKSTDPNDLSFNAGDIIEIIAETNDDWWTGKLNNRQGLFPSNYVEKLPETAAQQAHTVAPIPATASKKPYKAFRASYHGSDAPNAGTNSIGLQQDPAQEKKAGKLGAAKGIMANSAARGAGFGAGSAIGGGLVRKIF